MADASNPHKDHRARVRARFLAEGLSGFAPHNVLELLLFYPLPRRDTNPLAHALLSAHGSVGAVLSADAASLCRTAGIGAAVASFFGAMRTVRELAFFTPRPRVLLNTRAALARHLSDRLAGVTEGAAILYLDNAAAIVGERLLYGTSVHSASFPVGNLLREGLLCHASSVVVGHVHKGGLALPMREDLDTTILVRDVLATGGLSLLEHFIISGERYTSLLYRESGYVPRPAVRELPEEDTGDAIKKEAAALSALLRAARVSASSDELLRDFGGLTRLLLASPARYLHSGIDDRTATLLALVGATDTYIAFEEAVPSCRERAALGQYLCNLYRAAGEERVLLLLFDRRSRHVGTVPLGTGSMGEAEISLRRMAESALFAGAATAVLSHNHPFGTATPSDEDRQATAVVASALSTLGVALQCHYIVAESDFCVIE